MFDLLFWPFRAVNPLWAVTVFSVLTGVLMVLAFRYTSNQPAIRRVKNRIGAHILEVRLFQDQLTVVGRAYLRILRATAIYLGHSLAPLAVMLLPLVVLLVQMELRLGSAPAQPHKPLLLKARVAPNTPLDSVELRLPDGLTATAPPLRIAEENEVDWRIEAARAGEFTAEVVAGGQSFSKQVVVLDKVVRVSTERPAGWWDYFLHPGEPALPSGGPLESIRVNYPPREVSVAGWKMHWLIPFFVLSLISGYAVKGFFRTEF